MERFFRSVVRHKGIVLTVFAAVTVLCALLARQVQVNYDFVDYLPASSPSTIALDVMAEEFDGGVPNARLMVPDISVPEALALKEKLQEVDGIQAVTWLDDAADLHVPLAMLDEGLLRDLSLIHI